MHIRQSSKNDAQALSDFYLQNAEHLRIWEPFRNIDYHSVNSWQSRLKEREQEQIEGRAAYFIALSQDNTEILAVCSLTNIVKGPFQACNMGYAVSASYQGLGIMKQLCQHVIDYAFNDIGLNRIMANYMPQNQRSAALLNRLGFEKEGLAKRYLNINGQWEDHILTSLLNPKHI